MIAGGELVEDALHTLRVAVVATLIATTVGGVLGFSSGWCLWFVVT